MNSKKKRITWLAVLRGLNILLVVMVHIQLVDISTGNNHAFCEWMALPFHPIRMPLFIFISGGLLYLSRICRQLPVKDLYKEKFQRIMLPFLFFVIVYYFVKVIFNQFTKTSVDLSFNYFLASFVYYRGYSSQPLWFLAVLMLLMLMYPLFRYLCGSKFRMAAFLLFCCVIYFIDTDLESPWNVFYILELHHYLVYFFFGIFFFRFKWYNYLSNKIALPILLLLYITGYACSVPLFTSLTGILLMCSICLHIDRYVPTLFSSFRDYIFPIYLMSWLFQTFVELILWKQLCNSESLFLVFYAVNLLSGLFIPVLICKVIERCPIRLVRLFFGLQ